MDGKELLKKLKQVNDAVYQDLINLLNKGELNEASIKKCLLKYDNNIKAIIVFGEHLLN